MTDQQVALKFPETINPENMRMGESYLLAVRHSSADEFETFGPFTVNERPRRHKNGSVATHFTAHVFMINEIRRLPREEIVLPLSGHSSLYGKKMSLHPYSEEVREYFEKCNKNPTAPECKEAY